MTNWSNNFIINKDYRLGSYYLLNMKGGLIIYYWFICW